LLDFAAVIERAAAFGLISTLLLLPSAAADSVENATPSDGLSGRDIYELVVENRFRSFTQRSRLISADRTGREQESRFRMHWKDFRDEDSSPTRGILSKTIVEYTHPFDLRHAGYLIQTNQQRPNDQFIYYPSRRRVVRVNLRGDAVYGTDFSFEDVIPREAEDFAHRRLADDAYEGIPVYVVELFPREFTDSAYSKIRVFVDRERHVVLRARYWNSAGVELKEFATVPESIEQFDGVWVTMESTMRNLLLDSYTKLIISELVPNPEFARDTFDLGRLESH
jgi:hypothetical protein